MKKLYIALISLMLSLILAVSAKAITKNILITEVQTGTEASASQEFVEIFNNSNLAQDISGWSLYYKSATGSTWTKKATVSSKILNPGSFFVFASNLAGDISYSSTLSQSGGNVQIRDKSGAIMDQFGWGNANAALAQAASESAPGQSMYRIYDYDGHTMINTDNNFNDFDLSQLATPGKLPDIVLPEPDQDPTQYPNLELSELFPDPASPQTDTIDEFIEIYNPNSTDVDLSGWKIRDESGKEYIIKNKTILAGGRLSIKVTESAITLNNTGDSIRLINPNDEIVDESTNYGAAKEGLSWIKVDGQWQWSIAPSPDQSNADVYIEPQASPNSAIKNVKKAAASSSTKKKTGSVAKTKTSSSKPKTSKISSNSNSKNNNQKPVQEDLKSNNSNLWGWLLLCAGLATIGYGVYEYRTELQLFLKKLGTKFRARS